MPDRATAPLFADLFGRGPSHHGDAPGRVNLIGEHTDYNGGFVLPAAIPQRTSVDIGLRGDHRVRAVSMQLSAPGEIGEFVLGEEAAGRGWLDYVQAVTQELAREGVPLRGFDVRIDSQVPVGSGLSSSAALEIALLRALRLGLALQHTDTALALLAQRAENGLVNAPVGVMDQLACSLAGPDAALFIDVRALTFRRVELPARAELLVISSGIAHDNATGDYRTRRAECEQAAALLGVPQLRDLEAADQPRIERLPPPLAGRVRHVTSENARVLAAVEALEREDLPALGALFAASHRSMRDDYQVSIPAIDMLVALASGEDGVFGARLTGGGFGGSVVAVCRAGTAAGVGARVVAAYRRSGHEPRVLVPAAKEPS